MVGSGGLPWAFGGGVLVFGLDLEFCAARHASLRACVQLVTASWTFFLCEVKS